MRLHHFDVRDLPATPWKNGGGVTRELVCQPPGAGIADFDWRVSIAHIAGDGPFSVFPGVDRVITLLGGGGMHLRSDDGQLEHRLDTPLLPFAFAGELPVNARLLAGDCHDFNLMTRRAVCSASLQVVRQTSAWPATDRGLFMAVQGHWRIEGVSSTSLLPQQGLWWCEAAAAWRLCPQTADAALLALTFEPHSL